jgi:predicted protein tyrosine phosphatase
MLASEIIPNLFVGDYLDAIECKSGDLCIKRVVNCTEELPNVTGMEGEDLYMQIPVNDQDTFEDTLVFYVHIQPFLTFMDKHPLDTHPVLIHCQMGVSRSCSMAVAYLVHTSVCKDVDAAYKFVMEKRPQAFMNGIWIVYKNALNDFFTK